MALVLAVECDGTDVKNRLAGTRFVPGAPQICFSALFWQALRLVQRAVPRGSAFQNSTSSFTCVSLLVVLLSHSTRHSFRSSNSIPTLVTPSLTVIAQLRASSTSPCNFEAW